MTIVSVLLLTTGCANDSSGKRVISQQQKMETNSSGRLDDIEKKSAAEESWRFKK